MAQEGFKRKLTAILSADVKEYSRLMRDDEDTTIRTLTVYRKIIFKIIQQYRGRVVDSPGDNVLAEFGSIVDTVTCAVEIQSEIAKRNVELPHNRLMEFRIGINLGDVVEEDERIYGDGVNIAARVESLAEGGGVCISGSVYDSIEGKLGLEFEYIGEHEVKNIDKPIRVYRVLSIPEAAAQRVVQTKITIAKKWRNKALVIAAVIVLCVGAFAFWNHYYIRPSIEPTSLEKTALSLPNKPSIAVLPFSNMNDDPKHESFTDGISEDLTTQLSKISGLFVISRTSAFKYKGQSVDVRDVARDLGVRYVLEGSVRRAEDQVRINAQLIDATSGGHIWAETYDDRFKNVFALQDRINQKIISALKVRLTDKEEKIITYRGTNNVQAYDAFLLGERIRIYSKVRAFEEAEHQYERAIELDPRFGAAYAGLGHVIWIRAWESGAHNATSTKDLKRAQELADKAITLGDDPVAHTLLNAIYLHQNGDHERAETVAQRAIEIDPNSSEALTALAEVRVYVDKSEEAIELLKKAMRLNPGFPDQYRLLLGQAFFNLRRYQDALDQFSKFCKDAAASQYDIPCYLYQASVYGHMQEIQKGRAEIEGWLDWGFDSIEGLIALRLPFKSETSREHLIEGIRKVWPK